MTGTGARTVTTTTRTPAGVVVVLIVTSWAKRSESEARISSLVREIPSASLAPCRAATRAPSAAQETSVLRVWRVKPSWRTPTKMKVMSPLLQPTYQQIAYNRGIELLNQKDYDGAIAHFNKSLTYPVSRELNANAH